MAKGDRRAFVFALQFVWEEADVSKAPEFLVKAIGLGGILRVYMNVMPVLIGFFTDSTGKGERVFRRCVWD